MVDLHAHLLPFIDDGSGCVEDSFLMLDDAVAQGVTDIVLTPHLNDTYYPTISQVKSAFKDFQATAIDKGYKVNLYLGQEIYVGNGFEKVFSSNEFLTLNGTNFVLLEFDYIEEYDIAECVYQLKRRGYEPIVAHFERYRYADLSVANEVKGVGGYIQINADSCFGGLLGGGKKVKTLFENNLVDFVASDAHIFRKNKLKKAKEWIIKKYGEDKANAVLKENQMKIIKG